MTWFLRTDLRVSYSFRLSHTDRFKRVTLCISDMALYGNDSSTMGPDDDKREQGTLHHHIHQE